MQNCWSIKIFETRHATIKFIITTLFIIQLLAVIPQNVIAQPGSTSSLSSPYRDHAIIENPLELSPGMAILFVVLIAAFFILGCLSIYVRRYWDAWMGNRRGGELTIRGRTRHGIDPKVIDKFPTYLYSDVKGLKIGKGALECAVCLSEFEDDVILRLLPKCCHVFHTECIDKWLASHVTCPVCRADLVHVLEEEVITNNPSIHAGESVHRSVHSTRSPEISEVLIDITTIPNPVRSPVPNQEPVQSCLEITSIVSNSTGQDIERFTLRLPDGFQPKNIGMRRVVSNAVFPTEGSPKKWFRRSTSFGTGRGRNSNVFNEPLDRKSRSDRLGLSKSAQSFTRLTGNNLI